MHRDTLSWFLRVISCPQPFSSVTLTIKVWPPERGAKQLVHQLWWLQSIYFKWESPKFCWWHSHSKIYTQIKFHENTANNNIQLRSKLLAPFIKLSKTHSFSKEMTKTKRVNTIITSKQTETKSPWCLMKIFYWCTELKQEKTKMTIPKLLAPWQSIVNTFWLTAGSNLLV